LRHKMQCRRVSLCRRQLVEALRLGGISRHDLVTGIAIRLGGSQHDSEDAGFTCRFQPLAGFDLIAPDAFPSPKTFATSSATSASPLLAARR
jgi:hypothetical protein